VESAGKVDLLCGWLRQNYNTVQIIYLADSVGNAKAGQRLLGKTSTATWHQAAAHSVWASHGTIPCCCASRQRCPRRARWRGHRI